MGSHCLRWQGSIPGYVIGGIVVGCGGYLLYNTINKAGANSSRVVREPLLAEAMAAHRGDSLGTFDRVLRRNCGDVKYICFRLPFGPRPQTWIQ
jgi:hypothetical protein